MPACSNAYTKSPCQRPQGLQALWVPEPPHNVTELQLQAESIRNILQRGSQSPPTPTGRALNQLVKGYQMTMHSAILLASENMEMSIRDRRCHREELGRT